MGALALGGKDGEAAGVEQLLDAAADTIGTVTQAEPEAMLRRAALKIDRLRTLFDLRDEADSV